MELLDCTIRDGGYVNNWEFTDNEVKELYKAVSIAGFSYFEIGFRTNKKNTGKGKWFYCNEKDIYNVKKSFSNGCKISIMTRIEENNLDIDSFLPKNKSCIDMIRVFLTYENEISASGKSGLSLTKLKKCKMVLEQLKKLGYITCLNLGSTVVLTEEDYHNIFKIIVNNVEIDYIYFADSYGSILFDKFESNINFLKSFLKIYNKNNIKIGFHAHNNLGNAYTNLLKSIDCSISIVDSCVSGLGRGAGNLHSELLILHLYKYKNNKKYNIKPLLNYSNKFIHPIHKVYGKYKFGYNNLLMIAGMYNIHPNYAIELIGYNNLLPSECFDVLISIHKLNIQNYDKNLISTIITKKKRDIKVIFMDFDGTLTDGNVYINNKSEEIKTSNTKDGYIIKKLKDKFHFGIISGSDLTFFKKRSKYLGFKYVIDNVSLNNSKLDIINKILLELGLNLNNLAFIGDDINDLPLIQNVFSACPSDAVQTIKDHSTYICKKKGGKGCVREFIEFIS